MTALHRGLTDDLRLAHLLADDADSITMSRFKSLDLHVTSSLISRLFPTPTPRLSRPSAAPLAGPDRAMRCTARRWPTPDGGRVAG